MSEVGELAHLLALLAYCRCGQLLWNPVNPLVRRFGLLFALSVDKRGNPIVARFMGVAPAANLNGQPD